MQNCEIARLIGVSSVAVCRKRRKLRAPRPKDWHKRTFKPPVARAWMTVDWSKQDRVIAKTMGVSREWARQMRNRLGAPRATNHGAQRKTLEGLAQIKAKLGDLKGLTKRGAEKVLGFRIDKRTQVFKFLEKNNVLALGISMIKHPWHLMNFDLPSRVLEKILGLPCSMAAAHRYHEHLPKPKWGWRGSLKRPAQDTQYRKAVQAEKRKAKRFYDATRTTR